MIFFFTMMIIDNTHDISHNNWPSVARPQDSPRRELVLLYEGFANWTEAADDRANVNLPIVGASIVGHCSVDYWYANGWFADYRPMLSLPLSRQQLACQI